MSESEGVTAETEVPQGEVAETVEVKTEEIEDNSPDVESEEPEETVEEKVVRLERDVEGKQKAINRKTAALHDANKKYAEQRQEHERISGLLDQQKPDSEPSIDDYETHEEYVNALVDYRSKAEVTKQQQALMIEQQQIQQQQVMNERLSLRQSQEAEYLVDNPMYKSSSNEVDAYLRTIDESSMPKGTVNAILDQLYKGNVPAVIDYLGANNGENLDELGKIARMTPPDAAVEIYKTQQKLAKSPVEKKEAKKTLKPVKAVKGNRANTGGLGKHSSGDDVLKKLGLK